jgi:hypothetical protein
MSKLAKELNWAFSGKRVAADIQMQYVDVKSSICEERLTGLDELRISATMSTFAWVDKSNLTNAESIYSSTIYDLKRSIVEEMFGEFRPLIYDMISSIYERDLYKTRKLLTALEHQMFVEGL